MSSKCVKCGRAILIDEDRDLWSGTWETPADCDHTLEDICGFCFVPVVDHPGELCHSGTIVELRAELAQLRSGTAFQDPMVSVCECDPNQVPGEYKPHPECPVHGTSATSGDQCARCGGTRVEPGSGDHDIAVHRDNPYTGEPCSACQQGPAGIGHEKPNSRKLSADESVQVPSDGRSTMDLVFCGDPVDHDPHARVDRHPVLCTGADHGPMTVDEVMGRLIGRPSPGPLFYARYRLTLPGRYRITLPGEQT
jgi:hypothetical protein